MCRKPPVSRITKISLWSSIAFMAISEFIIEYELAPAVRCSYRLNRWRARILFACRICSEPLLSLWSYRAMFHGLRRVSTQQELCVMPKDIFPQATLEIAARRKQLAPDIYGAFTDFSERVFAAGALPVNIKQLIAVAAAHVTSMSLLHSWTHQGGATARGRRRKRSSKASGSRPRCARALPTRTQRMRSIRLTKWQTGLRKPQSYPWIHAVSHGSNHFLEFFYGHTQ